MSCPAKISAYTGSLRPSPHLLKGFIQSVQQHSCSVCVSYFASICSVQLKRCKGRVPMCFLVSFSHTSCNFQKSVCIRFHALCFFFFEVVFFKKAQFPHRGLATALLVDGSSSKTDGMASILAMLPVVVRVRVFAPPS